MKKSISLNKKLSLAAETVRDLRPLDHAALTGVGGGDSGTGGSCECHSYTCSDGTRVKPI